MAEQFVARGLGQPANVLVHRGVEMLQKRLRQQEDVLAPFAQGRRTELDHVEPVKQVLPEIVLADGFDDVLVGGGDEADIHPQLVIAPHARKRAVLQKAQQLGLQRTAHVADLVQENGAAVGFLHAAQLLFDSAGEGAFLVAEQFAFQQVFGDGGAVDADVVVLAAMAQAVQRPGDQLLARAAFPQDEHGGVSGGHAADQLAQLVHVGRLADDLLHLVGLGDGGAQVGVVLQQPVAFGATGHRVQQFLRRKGLGQIIHRAGLDGFDRQFRRGVGGDHQERRIGPLFAGQRQKLVAAHPAAQSGVGDDHEKLLLLQGAQGLLGRFRQAQIVTFPGKNRAQGQAHVFVVIYHQHRRKGQVHLG